MSREILDFRYLILDSRVKSFFLIFFLLVTFHSTNLFSQTNFIRQDTIPVYYNNLLKPFAWAGGVNAPQFSDIDLNQDGIMDLFVFDRSGNKIITFINLGTPNQVSYQLDFQYVSRFPKMHDWVLLRDYNCDGKMDIFTSNASQVEVYKNISTVSTGLQFQLVTGAVKTNITPNSSNLIVPLNVSWIDIPAIRDVDGDGDLDILNFGTGGTQVEFHKNLSEENFGSCDSLNFTLQTLCWGEFFESILDASISLNVNCSPPPINPEERIENHSPFLHSGSCLECINVDGDNDQDILIGDLANPYINLVKNGGSNLFAISDSIDPFYPGYDTAMNIQIFGCPYQLDVDNDGKKDLLFSPNAFNSSENFQNVWYYHNYGNDSSVRVHFIQKNFLVGDMIDLGEGSYPVFFDYDFDGDEDLFIGNKGYFDASGQSPCMIALFENIGNSSAPIFTHKSSDFAGIFTQSLGINGLAPTFGDIDGDGDADMITGDVNGKLSLFIKNPGSDTNFVLTPSSYTGSAGIDVGSFATPQLVDVDRDGKIDLLIGEQSGTINYYHNDGTTTAPIFNLITNFFGSVVVTQPSYTTGYSAPHLFDHNGSYILLVGSDRGWVNRYDNIDGNLTGTFTRTDSMYVSTIEGGRLGVAVADLNNDSLFDVVIGNFSGGVSLFYGDNSVSIEELSPSTTFNLFPNPASEQVVIETTIFPTDIQTFSIYNLAGEIVLTETIQQQQTSLNTSILANGIYFCSMTDKKGFSVNKKLVISR